MLNAAESPPAFRLYVTPPEISAVSSDSTVYTTVSMIRSMELILGLDPMTRFDALARPITTCFNDTPDLTPYTHVPNNVPLGERPPTPSAQSEDYKRFAEISRSLDWTGIDGADPYWYSRIQWFAATGGTREYPKAPGIPDAPGEHDEEDDD
jgi:hypothetical protein